MEQTTSRLRKTFRYPTDNDSDDSLPEALDEEEQESLIQTLHVQNAKTNTQYTRLLLSLPILCTLPYMRTLFIPQTSLLSILSITSLLSTSYLLYYLPAEITGLRILDTLNAPKPKGSNRTILGTGSDDGPLITYLPYLNFILSGILGVLGMMVKSKSEGRGGVEEIFWWGFEWVPAGVYGVVLLAKLVMGSVDPEEELKSLRYGFKGA